MKTLLIGFEDVEGRGQSVLLAGPNSEASKKSATFSDYKSGNAEYPKGVTRIEMWGEHRGRIGTAICIKAHGANEERKQAEQKAAEAKHRAELIKKLKGFKIEVKGDEDIRKLGSLLYEAEVAAAKAKQSEKKDESKPKA